MASIAKRTVKDGSVRYDVVYRDPDNRQRRKTFTRKVDAARFAATVEADKARGDYLDPDGGRVTFGAYAAAHLAAQTFDPSTRQAVELRLRLHAIPVLGGLQLQQIKPSTVQAWLRSLEPLAPSYRRVIAVNVSSVLAAAVDDGLIRRNPCRAGSVRAPKVEPRRVEPWPAQTLLAVRAALPDRYRILATLAAGLGLRQGELFGLSPTDVDFLRGRVEVRRQVRILGSRLVFAPPKGGKTRHVPLPAAVRDELAVYLAAFPARTVVLPWREPGAEPFSVPLVVTSREGKALNRNYVNGAVWKPALVAAGVEPSRVNGMHALRHTYASVLLDAGENIKAVSQYLGHADAGFTLRVYTHLMPSSEERTRHAVNAMFAAGDIDVTLPGADGDVSAGQ